MSIIITESLKEFIRQSPHVKQVYFTADGAYHLHAYRFSPSKGAEERLYSWIDPNAVLSKNPLAILERYAIVEVLMREQILNSCPIGGGTTMTAAPVADLNNPVPASAPAPGEGSAPETGTPAGRESPASGVSGNAAQGEHAEAPADTTPTATVS